MEHPIGQSVAWMSAVSDELVVLIKPPNRCKTFYGKKCMNCINATLSGASIQSQLCRVEIKSFISNFITIGNLHTLG